MLHKKNEKCLLKKIKLIYYYQKMDCLDNFKINKLIDTLIKNNIGNYKLHDNNFIKFRYEYINNNKNQNIFIYLKNWNQLINLYKSIPENERHFYEIINNRCKFFLDLDAKCKDVSYDEWCESIIIIKKELKMLFIKNFNKNIDIIVYQSFPSIKEPKYSCHLVIPCFCFHAEDCKNICNMILNTINIKYKSIIDDKVYGNRRMLRMEGSTKLNSDRKKICIYENKNNIQFINLDGLITNLENTEPLNTTLFENNKNKKINELIFNEQNEISIVLKQNKYNYTQDDIIFIKDNIKKIEYIINKWHYYKNKLNIGDYIFIANNIINNMIIFKRVKPFNCPDCNRVHEKQHPYSYVKYTKLFFHCRRSKKPIEVIFK